MVCSVDQKIWMKMSHPSSNVYLTSNVYNASFLRTAVQQYSTKPRKESKQKVLCALLYFPTYCSKVWIVQGMNTLREEILAGIKARVGGPGGQKNKFGLYQSPTCHGVATFYGIAKSSFMTKIWRVKVRGYYSVPYKI